MAGIVPEILMKVQLHYGTDPTKIGSVAVSMAAGEWKKEDLRLGEALSIQQVIVSYVGLKAGDLGLLHVINPITPEGYSNPATQVEIDDTTVDFGDPTVAAYFGAGEKVEFWNADDSELVEVRTVASVEGTVVTLGEAATHQHLVTARLRSIVSCFCADVADDVDHVSSGFRAVGSACLPPFGSENEATDEIPAGLILGHRFKTCGTAGDREIAVSYRFRKQ